MSCWEFTLNIIPYLITALVSVWVAVYSMRNSRQIKELDLKDNEKERVFEIEKAVTLKSLDAMADACFRFRRQVEAFAKFKTQNNEDIDGSIYRVMKEDLDSINLNKIFLPAHLRNDVHKVSSQLTNLVRTNEAPGKLFSIKVFQESISILEGANKSIEKFIEQYNLLNR